VTSRFFRIQLSVFYSGAMVWKLNSAFFDPTGNCPAILFLQLAANWLPARALESDRLVRVLALSAPHVTEWVEGGVAVLLAVPGVCERLGIALGLALHGLIALTPPPHNIAGYGIRLIARYAVLIPDAAADAASELVAVSSIRSYGAVSIAAVAFLSKVFVVDEWPGIEQRGVRDWLLPAYFALAFFVGRAAVLAGRKGTKSTMTTALPCVMTQQPSSRRRRLSIACVVEAVVFVFGLTTLGFADNAPPKPFSNIRIHGGSNHLFLPTDVLGRLAGVPTIPSDVVRVERTTSPTLNAHFPADLSSFLDPKAVGLLRRAGHAARLFGPAIPRNVGPDVVPPNGSPSFVRYTLPVFELRRALGEARAKNESFELTYTRFPRHAYDAARPRADPDGSVVVTLVEDGERGSRTCSVGEVKQTGRLFRGRRTDCAADEPALLAPPPPWAGRVQLFWPHVVLEDEETQPEGHTGYCMLE